MCGIVGYIGSRDAVPLLINGLERLEYRGYDSAGVALHTQSGKQSNLDSRKALGRLANLETELKSNPIAGSCGIGHTRWATHGAPSVINCHPHHDTARDVFVVHNGIIENYHEIKEGLKGSGVSFLSETDTEVIPFLIQAQIDAGKTGLEAICGALKGARGAYALGILLGSDASTMYAARLGSPLIIGKGKDGNFIASDVPAIVTEISEVIYLEDGQVAEITQDSVRIVSLEGVEVAPNFVPVTLEAESASKGGFETFMLKEVHEQPRVLRGLLHRMLDSDEPRLGVKHAQMFRGIRRIMIVSCGTAYYAGMYGRMILEHLTTIPVETDLGSEFRYRKPKLEDGTLIIPVSQSGETADTLASVRMAKELGCSVFSICNVDGSSLHRESDAVLLTHAGLEIGVASTKAFTAQLAAFVLLSLEIAFARGEQDDESIDAFHRELREIPDDIHHVLNRKDDIKAVADKHHDGPSALYLGRRFNFPIALEGALKNKEISYQHAEGYAAGEMKHGPIALINEYLPVVCICTQTEDELYEKMISNVKEVEARHGRIIAVATDGDEAIKEVAEDILYVPPTREALSPLVNVVALQLLAYYAASARGTDIDKPRNLAKSVTVE